MQFETEYSLKPHNSFGFDVKASFWASAQSIDDIRDAQRFCQENSLPLLVLGEGSNVVLVENYPGLVLKIAIQGKAIIKADEAKVWLKVGAGEHWHSLVQWTLDNDLYGLENLALIPGTVGAAPIQNIGAYGVELQASFYSLDAVCRETGELVRFNKDECDFGYRDSVFKGALRDRYIISHVTLCLAKTPDLKTDYGDIKTELVSMGVVVADAKSVAEAVARIRQRKLPDPEVIGNAGSFFKNPIISHEKFAQIQVKYPNIIGYAEGDLVKIAAGWLIEQCGWKGYRSNDAGVHDQQSLVLVNYGNADARQILDIAQKICSSVRDSFDLELEVEPRVYGVGVR